MKQRPAVLPPKPEPVRWVVGTDNSAHAKHALDTTLEMMGPDDKLHVFCEPSPPQLQSTASPRVALRRGTIEGRDDEEEL